MGDKSGRLRSCMVPVVVFLSAACGARSPLDLGDVAVDAPRADAGSNGPNSGEVLLFGGMQAIPNEPQLLRDTWEWDGTSWTERMVVGPSARAGAAFASLNGRVLLFGGWDSTNTDHALSDTWEWDGMSWTEDQTPGPPARAGGSAATLNGKIFLFGGTDPNGHVLNDTWQWDGSTWLEILTPTTPGGRSDAAMASLGGQIVMYGGTTNDGLSLGDTWAWDGQSWTLETSVDPQVGDPRYPPDETASGLRATTAAGKLLLLGGLGSPDSAEVMWTWAPPTWTPLDVPASESPVGRLSGEVATLGDDVVLFSGWGPEETETWTWDGTKWSSSDSDPKPQPRINAVMCGRD